MQIIATIGGAYLATYLKRKGPVLALLCIPPIAGCVMLLCIKHEKAHKGPLLAGYYLVSQISLEENEVATNLCLPDLGISRNL